MSRLPPVAVCLCAALVLLGCQPLSSQQSLRHFPDANLRRLWLAAASVAHRQWTVVSADSSSGHLVAIAGDGGRENRRPFEYRIQVAASDEGGHVGVRCWSSLFGRQVNLEELYLHEVAEKYDFLSPRGEQR